MFYGGYYGMDPTILLLIPAVIFSMWAQFKVKGTYSKYSEVYSRSGVTAEMAARSILDRFGLQNIGIERIGGQLTDHYDPSAKVLRLSVSESRSIAAIGVAAHECGHAIQDKDNYAFLRVRNSIVPVVNIASTMSMPLFFIGLLMSSLGLINLGILLFCGVLVFHLVTLPVEFDASARALRILSDTGLLAGDEITGAKKVLDAAALTYVAALLMTVLQLIRLLAIRDRSRN